MSLVKRLNRMGLKLLACFGPILNVKKFVMPFGKRKLSWTLIFSRRVINFSLTPYEYNLLNNPSLQIPL